MTNYKNDMRHIGASDAAALVMVGISEQQMKSQLLHFGKDGSYKCYFCNERNEIPDHYKAVAEFEQWLMIYDDNALTLNVHADKIVVYRAGEMGRIIQTLGNVEYIKRMPY